MFLLLSRNPLKLDFAEIVFDLGGYRGIKNKNISVLELHVPSLLNQGAKEECHKPDPAHQTNVSGTCPSSPEDEQEKQGQSKD
ncbi:hypothetical protein TNCV_716271 [Trichonephila clavipes]|nr:hypothetical protein TNCV_716271 [Trichonephila clavipes]